MTEIISKLNFTVKHEKSCTLNLIRIVEGHLLVQKKKSSIILYLDAVKGYRDGFGKFFKSIHYMDLGNFLEVSLTTLRPKLESTSAVQLKTIRLTASTRKKNGKKHGQIPKHSSYCEILIPPPGIIPSTEVAHENNLHTYCDN